MKRLLILFFVLIFAGCVATPPQPPVQLDPLPNSHDSQFASATLYFGFAKASMLISESRAISVPVNERIEITVVNELIEGPTAGKKEFNRLINRNAKLVNLYDENDIIFVTFSKEFIEKDESSVDEETFRQRSIKKQLCIYSIVNTLIELSGYSRVQILVDIDGTGLGQRISLTDVGFPGNGVLEPLGRQASVILNPYNTVWLFFDAITKKDYTEAYTYIAYEDLYLTSKPDEPTFAARIIEQNYSCESFKINDVIVSSDGLSAVIMSDFTFRRQGAQPRENFNIPIRIVRENDVWKIPYSVFSKVFLSGVFI